MVELRVARAPGRVLRAETGVQISEAALTAPGRGLVSLGQDIGQVGAFFQEFAKQKAVADDFKHRIEFESQRIKHDRNVREELRGVDEDKWVETYQKRMGEFLTGAGGQSLKKMSTGGQERVGGNHTLWLENNITVVQTNAFKTSSAKIAASLQETLDERALLGDVPQGIADIDEAVQVKAISPGRAVTLKKEFLGKVDNIRADASIRANPRSAREVIEDQLSGELKGQAAPYPNLTQPQLRAAHNRARAAEAKQKSDLYNEIVLKSEVGKAPELFAQGGAKTGNQLWQESLKLHENGDINDKQLISLRNSLFDPASKQMNTGEASRIRKKIFATNFDNMSTNEIIDAFGEIEGELFDAGLPNEVQRAIYTTLQNNRDGKGAFSTPENKSKLTRLQSRIKGLETAGHYERQVKEIDGIREGKAGHAELVAARILADQIRVEKAVELNQDKNEFEIWTDLMGLTDPIKATSEGVDFIGQIDDEEAGRTSDPVKVASGQRSLQLEILQEKFPGITTKEDGFSEAINNAEAGRERLGLPPLTDAEKIEISRVFPEIGTRETGVVTPPLAAKPTRVRQGRTGR